MIFSQNFDANEAKLRREKPWKVNEKNWRRLYHRSLNKKQCKGDS